MPLSGVSGPDFTALIQAIPAPVALVRRDGTAALNMAARARLAQHRLPEDWRRLLHEDSVTDALMALERAWEGQGQNLSVRLPDTVAPGLLTVVPAGTGGALLHLYSAHDPLEVALELLDVQGLGMTVQAQDGEILLANAAAQQILGLSLDQLTGRSSLDPRWRAIHPGGESFAGDSHPAMQALRSGTSQRHVPMGIFHPPSGGWRWLDVTAVPRTLPGSASPVQVTSVFEDVTERQETLDALRHSERRFRSLVEATAQIVWTTGPDGQFPPHQPAWQAFTGQTPEECEGRGWLSAVHPDDRAHTLEAWKRAIRHGEVFADTHRLRRVDGTYVPMRVRAVPVRDGRGEVEEWVGASSELQPEQDLQPAQATLHALLEERVRERTARLSEITRFSTLLLTAAGEGIFGLDASGVTTFSNPSAARMLGHSVERMIGARQHDLIHHHHADGRPYPLAECPIHRTLQDGQVRRVEDDVLWHAQGHAVPVSYVVTPTHDDQGGITGVVVMVQDSTERRQAQQELRAAIADLERSNHDLEQFAYIASHDLQEPLRTIGSYTQLLSRRYGDQLDGRAGQYLQFIEGAVDRMHGLVGDLLEFARLGRSGEVGQQSLALGQLVQAAEQNVHATRIQGGGSLSWDTPHRVLGRASLLTQLLTNLLGNALKFMPEGRAAQVHVFSRLQGQQVLVSVRDNGIGIEPEYAGKIFDIFQRLHPRDAYAGNGMGLAICRRIVELHGGRLWLESTPAEGSTFHFTLPAAPHHD